MGVERCRRPYLYLLWLGMLYMPVRGRLGICVCIVLALLEVLWFSVGL